MLPIKHKNIKTSPKKFLFGVLAAVLVLISFGLGYQAINNLNQQSNLATANSAPQPYGGCAYGTGTFGAGDCGLTTVDIAALLVTCVPNPAAFNTLTSCSFPLTANKVLPTDFKLSIGSGAINQATGAAQVCTLTGNTVTCANVPTGNSVGNMRIHGNLGSGTTATKTATASTLTVTGTNMAKANWVFAPNQGGTAPLFRSSDATNITIRDIKTIFDAAPSSNTRYTCSLEYRLLNDRSATTTWNRINTVATAYNTTSGCTFVLTKAMRNQNLNYSFRLTITDTSFATNNTFTLHNEYIYRFLGAGVASGG